MPHLGIFLKIIKFIFGIPKIPNVDESCGLITSDSSASVQSQQQLGIPMGMPQPMVMGQGYPQPMVMGQGYPPMYGAMPVMQPNMVIVPLIHTNHVLSLYSQECRWSNRSRWVVGIL